MIRLENDWVIDVDTNCCTLQKYSGNVKGKDGIEKPNYTNQRYYRTLKEAVQGYIRVTSNEILSGHEMSLADALKLVSGHLESIEGMLSKILRDNSNNTSERVDSPTEGVSKIGE